MSDAPSSGKPPSDTRTTVVAMGVIVLVVVAIAYSIGAFSVLSARLAFWWQLAGFLWTLGFITVWTIFSESGNVRGCLPRRWQKQWRRLMLRLSWQIWLTGVMAILLFATVEGSFRLWRNERDEVDRLTNYVKELQRQMEVSSPNLKGEISFLKVGGVHKVVGF